MQKPYMIDDRHMQIILQALSQGPYGAVAATIAELQRQMQLPASPMPGMDAEPLSVSGGAA